MKPIVDSAAIDIALGGTFVFEDGRSVDVAAHSQRVFLSIWPNGAVIEVLYFDEPLEGEYEGDRIQLMVTPEGQEMSGWLMSKEDAEAVVAGLTIALDKLAIGQTGESSE